VNTLPDRPPAADAARGGKLAVLIRNPRAMAGLLAVASVILLAVLGPFLAPYSPLDFIDAPFQPPSESSWLGSDALGRDVLSRILWGGYRVLAFSALATFLGVALGSFLGIFAGYEEGAVDELVMRLLDVLIAVPQIILVLLFVSIVGPEPWLILIMVAVNHVPSVARVVRSATLKVAKEDYVRFAELIGTARRRIIFREILPNVLGVILVETGLRFTYSIALIAGLGFLGFGTQPPTADWGLLINENRIGLTLNPLPVLVPVVLIAILTIGTNLFTDALGRVLTGRDTEA